MTSATELRPSFAVAARAVTVVGRADARGKVAYNERLGLLRAERVKAFLVEHGVDANRIQTTTRGEREAKGDGF